MFNFYKLNEDKTVSACTLYECVDQIQEMCRTKTKHVADDYIDGMRISTVWLGIDHGSSRWLASSKNYRPILFETIVFENPEQPYECYCDQYSTWEEAEEGHKKAIEWVKNGCKEEDSINE